MLVRGPDPLGARYDYPPPLLRHWLLAACMKVIKVRRLQILTSILE